MLFCPGAVYYVLPVIFVLSGGCSFSSFGFPFQVLVLSATERQTMDELSLARLVEC